jgi:predicted RNA-binding Zn-ribbon protein involved in translation (DUF1610 family)
MTNREAIERLILIFERCCNRCDAEALDLAIKALEPDEEVNEFTCPFCGDVTYTATDYIPRFCQECGRDMGFREAENER